jgi:flagellar hook-associated protein 2
LSIVNDTSSLKTNIKEVVTNYNDLMLLLDNFTAVDSDADMAGALADDTSMVRFLRDKIKTVVLGESSTPTGDVTALRNVGVSINQYGTMTFTEATYDSAVISDYSDIVTMLTADTSNESLFTTSNKGLAQDVITALGAFTGTQGTVTLRESAAETGLSENKDELEKLEARMDTVYKRYLKQFGAMETLMATLDSTKDYLTSQLESLSKVYDDK